MISGVHASLFPSLSLSLQHCDSGGDPGPGRLSNMGHLVQCLPIHTYRGDGRICDISMDNVDIT